MALPGVPPVWATGDGPEGDDAAAVVLGIVGGWCRGVWFGVGWLVRGFGRRGCGLGDGAEPEVAVQLVVLDGNAVGVLGPESIRRPGEGLLDAGGGVPVHHRLADHVLGEVGAA